jgi:hypothetical protein
MVETESAFQKKKLEVQDKAKRKKCERVVEQCPIGGVHDTPTKVQKPQRFKTFAA